MLRLKVCFFCMLAILTASCGNAPKQELDVHLDFQGFGTKASALVEQITHADLVFFKKDTDCKKITPSNYKNTKNDKYIKDQFVGSKSLTFDNTKSEQLVQGLTEGKSLVLYVFALASDEKSKVSIAEGCKPGVTLEKGKSTAVTVKMNKLK